MSNKQNDGLLDCGRRNFIRVAGLGAAAMTIPGFSRNAGASSMPDAEEKVVETDVLVVGGGFAGTFAAVKAKEQGVDVTMAMRGTVGRSGMAPWSDEDYIYKNSMVYDDLKALGAVRNIAVIFRRKINDMGIDLLERVKITDLLLDDGQVTGAVGCRFKEDKPITIKAKSVVLTTGAGGYKPNGFPLSSLTFDGNAIVYKHGIPLSAPQAMPSYENCTAA